MRLSLALAAAFFLAALPARSEVLDSSPAGFTVRTTVTIGAPPDEVYRRILHNIGDWWSSDHTYSGDAHNMSIEEKPMGCFCEKLPNGGVVRHMEVVYLAPGKTIGLNGALGPLGPLAAIGSMQIQLTPAGGGTNVVVNYAVAGYLPKGMNTWAAPVDDVLNEQFTRLKAYVERVTSTK
jgi:uncharacterized protein YndB with AHSA1/START domain